jgi:UPF0716 protein FxsA
MRLFALYLVIEMAVIVALVATIGFGWTVLLLAGAFAFGLMLAGSQLKRQLTVLQGGMHNPAARMTDSVLVALGSVLMIVPGLVTSVAGLLMLLPPTRVVMRPLTTALGARTLGRRIPFVDLAGWQASGGDYIDGEVIEVHDVADSADPTAPTKYLAQRDPRRDEAAAQRPHP